MAYDRYDTRDEPRGGRERWRDDRFEGRGRGGRDDEDRGFFERMGDEVRSWFGDEDDERGGRGSGHSRDYGRSSERGRDWGRDEDRGRIFGQDRQEGRGRSGGGRAQERGRFSSPEHDEDSERFWRERTWGSGDYEGEEDDFRPSRRSGTESRGGERRYQPMTGDYGRGGGYRRSEQFFAAGGMPRGGYDRDADDRSGYGRSQTPYGRDEYRRTSFAGSSERSRDFDPHYHSWRQRQMDDLDRDYDDYRRERQSRFEDDFGSWRERRTQKRGLLGQIREHMEVIGNDGERVGTVDRVAGDRIILAKSDPESGGVHHSLSCGEIDRVEGDRVILDCSATEARIRWRDESRSRALFEREDQGEMGPHVLDRSFEGTYR